MLDPSEHTLNGARLRSMLDAYGEYPPGRDRALIWRFLMMCHMCHTCVIGEYPGRYRVLIWRFLLQLPENADAYAWLRERGAHPSSSRRSQRGGTQSCNLQKLEEAYPLRDGRMMRKLQAALSAFAHWSPVFGEVGSSNDVSCKDRASYPPTSNRRPVFGEVEWLPALIFPFVLVFADDELVAFEVGCMTQCMMQVYDTHITHHP